MEGHPESSHYLRAALTKEGLNVRTVPATAIPTTIRQLDKFDAVVLSDVARRDLSPSQMRAIVSYVRDLGGGLVLAGGENNYGEDGYSHTEIERVLPVTFDTKKERPKSVAIAVVLDRSGSMAGDKIDLAKEATKAPLELLTNEDFFGVVMPAEAELARGSRVRVDIDLGRELNAKRLRQRGQIRVVPFGVPHEQRVAIVEQLPGRGGGARRLALELRILPADHHIRALAGDQASQALPIRQSSGSRAARARIRQPLEVVPHELRQAQVQQPLRVDR